MPNFEFDFEGVVPEFGNGQVTANDLEQAAEFAYEYVRDAYPEMDDVNVSRIREILN